MFDNTDGLLIEDIEFGWDGGYYGIYDGIIAWKLKDGRVVNRFSGVPGYERRAEHIQALIDAGVFK